MAKSTPHVSCCELVARDAVLGDGGNAWGGHQVRIVRTAAGIFTAYTTGQSDPPGTPWRSYDGAPRFWKLATRTEAGWKVLAEGPSGREPVNLMAAPDGTLHIIAWPDARPHLWSGKPVRGAVTMRDQAIEGPWVTSHWPYNAAGISERGDIALVQSEGEVPGAFIWGCRQAGAAAWITGRLDVPHRHCYTYVLPSPDGRLAFSSTRDVLATSMGYGKAATSHSLGYVFNRLGIWETPDVVDSPLGELQVDETVPTPEFTEVWACGVSCDTYRDTRGRLHVLYFFQGPESRGRMCLRHAIADNGKLVKTVTLPAALDPCFTVADLREPWRFCRMTQDTAGRFYLIGTKVIIPADAEDGTELDEPVPLDLRGHVIERPGFSIAAPRSGTPLGDTVDAVISTDQGMGVVYVRIRLR
jgi:hypothetical protein